MTETYECFDASNRIPATAPPGFRAVLGYLNTKPDPYGAADPWTLGDWLRFAHLRQFPCWVGDTAMSPVPQAQQAMQEMVLRR